MSLTIEYKFHFKAALSKNTIDNHYHFHVDYEIMCLDRQGC